MRASLKKKKRERFSLKTCEGRELSNPGRTQQQREIKTRMRSETKTKRKEKTKPGSSKTQIKQMFITEVVTDN